MKSLLLLLVFAVFCGTARAQKDDSLYTFFQSEPGVRPGQLLEGILDASSPKRFDADGDSQADLVLRRDNEQGQLQDIRVLSYGDKASTGVIWEVRDVGATLGITSSMDMWGFADANADGLQEAIFYDDTEVLGFNLENNELAWKIEEGVAFRLLGAGDLTGDGFQEVIVYLEGPRVVKVYSGIMFETHTTR